MIGYIYIITNLLNDKVYVGQRKRSNFDFNYWGSGQIIKKAIKKYGKENFSRDVIEWCESIDDLNDREKYYIREYRARDPEFGYNLTDGGDGALGLKMSDESRRKLSKAKKGCTPWNKGKHGLQEAWNKGKKCPTIQQATHKREVKINGILYESINEALRQTKLCTRALYKILKNMEENK